MSRNLYTWDVFWTSQGTDEAECSRKLGVGVGGGLQMLMLCYALLKSIPSRQFSKVLYCWRGVKEKKKDRKSRSEEKVVSFCSASVFPARKRETVT